MVAGEQLKEEVREWAGRIGVEVKQVHIRVVTKKLGGCSSRGHLTFDTSLLTALGAVRSEAIIHELLHLKCPNHGRMFRALLRAYSCGASPHHS